MRSLKFKCSICGDVQRLEENLPIVHLMVTVGGVMKSSVYVLCKDCGKELKIFIEDIKNNRLKFNKV